MCVEWREAGWANWAGPMIQWPLLNRPIRFWNSGRANGGKRGHQGSDHFIILSPDYLFNLNSQLELHIEVYAMLDCKAEANVANFSFTRVVNSW